MKKKLISLVFGLFMCVFSVFSLASCSTINENSQAKGGKVAVKVGDVELTKNDIANSFYTYYQNNSSYFSYYDNETIEESFYTWAIIKELINQRAAGTLYDADTNPEGFIVFDAENEKNVWKNVYNYIYNQVSSYEKNVYTSAGYEDEYMPVWITEPEEETEETSFEEYLSIKPDGVNLDKSQAVKKLTNEQVLNYASATATSLKKYLFEHAVEVDENDNEVRKSINEIIADEQKYVAEIEKNKFIEKSRLQAYVDYIAGLVNTAKSSGKKIDEQKLINDEIIRVYEAYYESEVTTLLQTYYLDEYLISGEDTPLTEKAVAEAFLKDYYTDYQSYQFEDAYITTMTSSDGASLVLYHYDGQNYFFTVQHILVQNDEYLTDQIKNLEGYDETGKLDYDIENPDSIGSQFLANRKNLTDNYFMASVVNEKNIKASIEVAKYAKYYYYDESRTSENSGYIQLVKVEEQDKEPKYYEDADKDGIKDAEETTEIDKADVKYLISDEDIELCYKENFVTWQTKAKQYAGYVATKNATEIKNLRDNNEDLIYVFDTIENLIKADDTQQTIDNVFKTKLNEKIASYLFVELEWVFSSDSLGNKLSNKMGYVMSNYPDEHGSWVSEFADGARDLITTLKGSYSSVQEGIQEILNDVAVDASALTTKVISTFGYHIIKVEDVFECGSSVIDIEKIKTDLGATKIDLNTTAHLDAVIKAMKQTYVCSASNQTIYDYYFDELYTGFVGSSWLGDTSNEASSGTYFLKLEYEWLYELYQADKIEYVEKMTYDELMASVS